MRIEQLPNDTPVEVWDHNGCRVEGTLVNQGKLRGWVDVAPYNDGVDARAICPFEVERIMDWSVSDSNELA